MTFKYGDRVKGQNSDRVGPFITYLPKDQARVYFTEHQGYASFPLGMQTVSANGLDMYSPATVTPKFQPGQRVMGLVSRLAATVLAPKYNDHGRWMYDIEYDEPKAWMDKVTEAIESNLEPLGSEPKFKPGDYVRLNYSRRIGRLDARDRNSKRTWHVTIVRDEDNETVEYPTIMDESVMTIVPAPEPVPTEPTPLDAYLAAVAAYNEACKVKDAAYRVESEAKVAHTEAKRAADEAHIAEGVAWKAVEQAMRDHVKATQA
jgi:hypothetical protein